MVKFILHAPLTYKYIIFSIRNAKKLEADLLIVKNNDLTQLIKTRNYRHPFRLLLKKRVAKGRK